MHFIIQEGGTVYGFTPNTRNTEGILMGKDIRKIELPISGMHCASCAVNIEKALSHVEGVHLAEVHFGAEKAVVTYDSDVTDPAVLTTAVESSGYGVRTERVIIQIGGMMCAVCVQTIEGALKKLNGIIEVSVNLGTERAYITYNPILVSLKEMRDAIIDAGYQYLGTDKEQSIIDKDALLKAELSDRLRRVIVGFGISALLMAMMAAPESMMHTLMYLQFLIATPVFFWLGIPIFRAAYGALKNRTLNMDVMYALGTTIAYVASVLATFGIVLDMSYIFYETAIMLTSFLMLGRYLEARAKGQTSSAISGLIKLQAVTAMIIRNDEEFEIPVEEVGVGDLVRIRPGDRIPVDGIITAGTSFVDESMVTGEPVPVEKLPGDEVIAGTLATSGTITFEARRIGADTMLATIIRLVEEAQGTKPPVQRIADKVVSFFIPTVLVISIGAFLYWYYIAAAGLQFALQTFIAILVVACPCALGLATPTAVTVGVGRGAELGILIRNGAILEVSDRLTTVLFDKTGTLTKGTPSITDVDLIRGTKPLLLSYATGLESLSTHPLGKSIENLARSEGIESPEVEDFAYIPGKGLVGRIAGGIVRVGNLAFIQEMGILISQEEEDLIQKRQKEGKTTVLVSHNTTLLGIISIADTIKPDAELTIRSLKGMGISSGIVTGDNQITAEVIAHQAGINRIIAGVLPDRKEQEVSSLQGQGEVVAFVGDGINDAPALAKADCGIAIGSGTDIAIESADIILVRDTITDTVAAIQLARKVMGRIRLNLFWAFAYNIILIPLAGGILAPSVIFRPEYGALVMALSSVTVISLSLLLHRYTPPIMLGEKFTSHS